VVVEQAGQVEQHDQGGDDHQTAADSEQAPEKSAHCTDGDAGPKEEKVIQYGLSVRQRTREPT